MSWDWLIADDYWSSRLLFQRLLAALYLVAFASALNQFRVLLGQRGLLPVPEFVRRVPLRRSPSLFHLHYSDRSFRALAWTGIAVSGALLVGVADLLPVWGCLLLWALPWVLYLSIVNVGQVWYSFGWESLLLETGFLAIFLGPAHTGVPLLPLLLLLWVLFRVEFGAGLIKLRGDRCWRDLTCLYYHHETQPMPGPWSWHFHHLPRWAHRVEAGANHVAQLVVPFVLFAPQPAASVAAGVVIVTQGWLLLSGNFAWLNALTMTLAVPALDGALLGVPPPTDLAAPPTWYHAVVLAVTVLIVVLSYWPVRNLLGRGQLMNFSFNPLHLANTYGAFGTVTRDRYEVIVEGTDADAVGADTVWHEFEFKGKPGDPYRRPPQVAPYHLRLDWLLWFVALSPRYGGRWLPALVTRLLTGDPEVRALLRHDPFAGAAPTHVRARLFHYRFTTRAERASTRAWWVREPVGTVVRVCHLGTDGTPVPG
ncbi:lipase maturation factor family protein [Saccharomonospora piscinae]|uniref:lipase maturation factor family protein n=1 Tax=Saccharomonospora piscinae TaxID=687388 RepID=UPI0011065626|nr:lipase maturation factor family protein [Saccharomonospora piscinae]TLW92202.1 lipase maturation factor family protein [Saccharomonospora piscinae]